MREVVSGAAWSMLKVGGWLSAVCHLIAHTIYLHIEQQAQEVQQAQEGPSMVHFT